MPHGYYLEQISRLDRDWMRHGACVGENPDLFFPARGDGKSVVAARQICMRCTVRATCLDYAVQAGERFGIWGGLSERERRAERKRRRAEGIMPPAVAGTPRRLSPDDETRIRRLADTPGHTSQNIADEYGVSRRTIMRIIAGHAWGELA